jgi:chromate transporter
LHYELTSLDQSPRPTLGELAKLFLRLGFTAFGGPAAHIALMQREFVDRTGWIDRPRFLDMLGAVNLMPGPNSTELAISIGAELHGRRGLVVAGACFITPAFTIVVLLAWLYRRYGALPDVNAIMMGVKPVALAIIAQALWKLGGTTMRRPALALLAIAVFIGGMLGVHELLLLLGGGLAAAAMARTLRTPSNDSGSAPRRRSRSPKGMRFIGMSLFGGLFAAPTVGSILLYFLYLGSVLYGSGYVLVAFLHNDLVGPGWLNERQLLDAVAVGQVTPGPLFTTATFVGFILGGFSGSVAATIGIFLPSFLFVLFTHRWIARLRGRPSTAAFLDGVNAGALGLIALALVMLGRDTLAGPFAWTTGVIALAILLTTRINPAWLVVAGAIVGWIAGSLGWLPR